MSEGTDTFGVDDIFPAKNKKESFHSKNGFEEVKLEELFSSELSAIQDAIAASYSRLLSRATGNQHPVARKTEKEHDSQSTTQLVKFKNDTSPRFFNSPPQPVPMFPLVPSECSPVMEYSSDASRIEPSRELSVKSPTLEPSKRDSAELELLQIFKVTRTSTESCGVSTVKRMDSVHRHLIKSATSGDVLKSSESLSSAAVRQFGCDSLDWHPVDTAWTTYMIHPHSFSRACWDILSLVLVVYDIVYLPLGVFDPGPTTFALIMAWTSRMFWTLDLPATFVTGFLAADGCVVLQPRKIAYRYLSTFFILDVFLVGIDWSELIWSEGSSMGIARIGKASRFFRIMRMLRLLRLLRMHEVFKHVFFERIRDEKFVILVGIGEIMLMIVGLAHFVACIWYGIGVVGDESRKDTWVRQHELEDRSLMYRYATSLHWSLSQFSGGMDEVRPYNVGERIFAVVTFIIGFMAATLTVSELTSSVTRLHIIASHQSRHLAVLRRYLVHNCISDNLALRIQRNAYHVLREQQRMIPEEKVELLRLISEPLRADLRCEMHSPVFEVHPFFDTYSELCPQVMRQICHEATLNLLISKGDTVFYAGERPKKPKMYFVVNGSLSYIPMVGKVSIVGEAHWLSETSLWARWMHRGILQATADCRLLLLDAQVFQEIISQFEVPEFDVRKYAQEFVKLVNEREAEGKSSTDLPTGIEPKAVKLAQSERLSMVSGLGVMKRKSSLSALRTTFRRASVLMKGNKPKQTKVSFLEQ